MESLLYVFTSPPVILFIVGILAAVGKSNLKMPDGLSIGLNMYLLLAIGIKGGMGLAEVRIDEVVAPLAAVLILGLILPIVGYFIGVLFKFTFEERVAMAATFGSVSLVTFAAATAQLDQMGIGYEPYMTTLVVLLEIPGLVVALMIYQHFKSPVFGIVPKAGATQVMLDSLMSKSILLLIAGLVAGYFTPDAAMLKPFFVDLFPGVLLLFLLGLGLKVGQQLGVIKEYGWGLIAAGIVFPVIGAVIGYMMAQAAGFSEGGTVLFMALAASGSYIAAPAMLQASVPDVKPSFYLTMALAVTFPFNLIVGIPLFIQLVAG
ncbi:sodium-dependent bicarbonate transport family permease [Salipaludibacillus sp. CUR1]|uniref:sodium-dependent bicarbonate transport family permease n=1 Tax=Salipaludibacillus sp. CUR1 TaxID=2820003 RepID=UPI001E5E5AF0|nr:sodium-dependent bicarbonate transport family permease [Salipaludibacillus sp. CUR1]MCE7794510.1 sodium-dependent bicarbonate transport family permease [Salipaludibacillus sp. CUR1]